jgi:hypothetical protein
MRFAGKTISRTVKWTFAGIAAIVLSLIIVCFADNRIEGWRLYVRSYCWGREPFDALKWRKFHPEDESLTPAQQDTRGRMLYSLLRDHRLGTLTRSEVEDLIGPPERDDGGYWIGNQTGFKIDPDILYISYESSGHVSDFRTEQH